MFYGGFVMKCLLLISGALVAAAPLVASAKPPAIKTTHAEVQAQLKSAEQQGLFPYSKTEYPNPARPSVANATQDNSGYGGTMGTGQQASNLPLSQSMHSLYARH